MPGRPPFIVELWRRQPWGLMLQAFAFVSLGLIGYTVMAEVDTGVWPYRLGPIAIAALAVGMVLTHLAAVRLARERKRQDVARSSAPWDR